jgi:hypothetical protein
LPERQFTLACIFVLHPVDLRLTDDSLDGRRLDQANFAWPRAKFQRAWRYSIASVALADSSRWRGPSFHQPGATVMSKSQDQKKMSKKEPAKTPKEKKEAKKLKKEEKKRV